MGRKTALSEKNIKETFLEVFGEDSVLLDSNSTAKFFVGDFHVRAVRLRADHVVVDVTNTSTHNSYTMQRVDTLADLRELCIKLHPLLVEITTLAQAIGPLVDTLMGALGRFAGLTNRRYAYSDPSNINQTARDFLRSNIRKWS
jgi:hypothetical protein